MTKSIKSVLQRRDNLYNRDRNAKAIIMSLSATQEEGQNFLRTSWTTYGMMNIIFGRLGDKSNLELSIYDPFLVSGQERGKVFTYNLQDHVDVPRILDKIKKRLWNVHKYPLRICIFINPGTVSPDVYTNGTITKFTLQDGEIMHFLAGAMNFDPLYVFPKDGVPYGHKLPNGSITGSLKDIDNGDADILANLRPVKDYGQKKSEFLFPPDTMNIAFIVPKIPEGSTVSFLEIYSLQSSILIGLTYFMYILIWKVLDKYCRCTNLRRKPKSVVEVAVWTFGNYLLVSQPGKDLMHERCLYSGLIFFSMINAFTYQATMVEHLTSSVVSQDINSMQDLAETDLKVITVTGFKELLKDIAYAEGSAKYFMDLYRRQELVDNQTELVRRVAIARDSAMLYSLMGCRINELKARDNVTGAKLLHVLLDAPPDRYAAHMIPNYSPYKDRFNYVLMKIRESGFMPKWRDDVYHEIERQREVQFRFSGTQEGNVYKFKDLMFIFYSWFACCGFCCLVFVGEVLWFWSGTASL